jgi:hypothetical protein
MRDHLVNSNGAALCMDLLQWSEGEPRLAALCFFLAANLGFRSEASRNELYMAGFVPLLVTNMRLCPDKTEVQYFAVSYVPSVVWKGAVGVYVYACREPHSCTPAQSHLIMIQITIKGNPWIYTKGACREPHSCGVGCMEWLLSSAFQCIEP